MSPASKYSPTRWKTSRCKSRRAGGGGDRRAGRRTGQAVKLFVVKRDPALDEADLESVSCTSGLAGYKSAEPSSNSSDYLPKSNIGKILRKELH